MLTATIDVAAPLEVECVKYNNKVIKQLIKLIVYSFSFSAFSNFTISLAKSIKNL
jgi:hypothetical protein